MRQIALSSLLIVLSLPAFGTEPAIAPTSVFNDVTSAEDAFKAYEDAASKIITNADSKGAKNKEIKMLQEKRDNVLKSRSGATTSTTGNNGHTAVTNTTPDQAQEEKINELREKYDAAKEKEQSTANKLLGGATMMATGMGAMELASSMSEQKADQEAEDQMRAYLSTFYCQYGNKRVPGGTKNAEIGGGNELINLYAQYVNLANDLKARKAALGIAPGIESEAILDSATAGLHDDENIGKRGSMFTSLARALADPTGEDAQKWKAQQEESAKGIKSGAIALGVGAVGSAVIDLAINHTDDDEDKEDKKNKPSEARLKELCKANGEWNNTKKTCKCINTEHKYNKRAYICTSLKSEYIKNLSDTEKKNLQDCTIKNGTWDEENKKCN